MATTNWKTVSGDWSTGADWTSGVPNSPTTVANLAGSATYIVTVGGGEAFKVGTVNMTDANAGLSINGTLTVATLVNVSAGTLTLAGGEITGGAIRQTGGGSIVYSNGLLDKVKFEGTMDLSATGAIVRISDGLSLTGSAGTGAGTANVTGASSQMDFDGTQTIDKATINIGSTNGSYLQALDSTIPGAALTLGAGLNLVTKGSVTLTGSSDATIINKGKITASTGSNSSFSISNIAVFTNAGSIAISNGENFTINVGTFNNTGTITVATGAVLHLNSSLTTAALSKITATNGTVSIDGTLDNTGTTLNVGKSSALRTVTLTGAIENGTIHDGGTGFVYSNGTFDAVTYKGLINLNTSGATLKIYDGIKLGSLTGTGAGAVNITGQSAQLDFYGTQTVDNATIRIGSATNTDYLIANNTGPTATLTFGSKLSLVSAGATVNLMGNAKIVNKGTITASTGGGTFTVTLPSFVNAGKITIANGESFVLDSSNFSNTGTITVTTGGVLHLNSPLPIAGSSLGTITATTGTVSIDGTLDDTGTTLSVGKSAALNKVTLTGAIENGVIKDTGTGFVFSGGSLDAVTYEGIMNINTTGAVVKVYDGIKLTDSTGKGMGTANITGQSAQMDFYGTQTVDNATIRIGIAANTDYLIANNTGPKATLTLGTNLSLIGSGAAVNLIGSGVNIVNKGTISATASGGTFTINPTGFANAGKIIVTNGETMHVAPTAFINTGTAEVVNGTLDLGTSVSGTGGTLKIDAAGTLEVERAIGSGQKVSFSGQGGRLRIDDANEFAAGVSGFTGSDVINLSTIAMVAGTTKSYSGTATGGTLKVTDGTHTASIHLFGQYVASGFNLAADSHGGIALTYTAPQAAHTVELAAVH